MRRRGDLDAATYNQLRDKLDQVYDMLNVAPPPRLSLHSSAAGNAPLQPSATKTTPVRATIVPVGSETAAEKDPSPPATSYP